MFNLYGTPREGGITKVAADLDSVMPEKVEKVLVAFPEPKAVTPPTPSDQIPDEAA